MMCVKLIECVHNLLQSKKKRVFKKLHHQKEDRKICSQKSNVVNTLNINVIII